MRAGVSSLNLATAVAAGSTASTALVVDSVNVSVRA